MLDVIFSPFARRDIRDILEWTIETFGAAANDRYQRLIEIGIQDLAENPDRPGSIDRSDVAPGYRVYHLSHSKKRAAKLGVKVRNPRHFVLVRVHEH